MSDAVPDGWPWPDLPAMDLLPYHRGLFTLATFIEGRDLYGAWAAAPDVLPRFLDVVRKLVQIRESGRRIPVRCHVTGADLETVERLIDLVVAWRADGGDLPAEVRDLAVNVVVAVDGTHCQVERGEPFPDG